MTPVLVRGRGCRVWDADGNEQSRTRRMFVTP